MKEIKYKCPECGKSAILGKHFCIVKNTYDPEEYEKEWELKKRKRNAILIIIAAITVVVFSWGEIGYLSLLVLFIPGILLLLRYFKPNKEKSNSGMYNELLMMMGRDKNVVERLIVLEMNKNPKLSRSECIQMAFEKNKYERNR